MYRMFGAPPRGAPPHSIRAPARVAWSVVDPAEPYVELCRARLVAVEPSDLRAGGFEDKCPTTTSNPVATVLIYGRRMNDVPKPAAAAPRAPVSLEIRQRIKQAKQRFHANDNISAFLGPGDLEALLDEVTTKMEAVLESLVIDTEGDHNTKETARRVAKMYLSEVFRGRYLPAPPVTEFPNAAYLNELMIVGPITVRSACSHHFCPIMGRLWIGLMPNEHSNLIGLSKYSRLAEWIMCRPQIQEEAIMQLADVLMNKVTPDGLDRKSTRLNSSHRP